MLSSIADIYSNQPFSDLHLVYKCGRQADPRLFNVCWIELICDPAICSLKLFFFFFSLVHNLQLQSSTICPSTIYLFLRFPPLVLPLLSPFEPFPAFGPFPPLEVFAPLPFLASLLLCSFAGELAATLESAWPGSLTQPDGALSTSILSASGSSANERFEISQSSLFWTASLT